MEEIISPKIYKSDTALPINYGKYLIPDSLTTEDKDKVYREILNNIVKKEIELEEKIADANNKVDDYKNIIDNQGNKAIEIIGIFSAILALLIIDVSVIKSVNSFLSAMLLIIALTCSVSIFAVLIHTFFSPEDNIKIGKSFWIPNIILIILTICGLILYVKNININENKIEVKDTNDQIKPSLPSATTKQSKQI